MPTLPLPTRALTAAILSGTLGVAAQADTLVDIYELALENDAQLKTQIAQYNADIELEKLALAPLLPQAGAGYSFTDSENDRTSPNVVIIEQEGRPPIFDTIDVTSVTETETDGYDRDYCCGDETAGDETWIGDDSYCGSAPSASWMTVG